ncbi:30S ribosomal protein S21 [Candidatus Woesebacteria bacterium]|nr:30S ribosomal protein S21 [Candidatus Woesebacteria bacterium]
MAIIIKSSGSDSLGDLVRRFKKQTAIADVVQQARDRQFYRKPSRIRSVKKTQKNRLARRVRSLKKMKNISAATIQRLNDRLAE